MTSYYPPIAVGGVFHHGIKIPQEVPSSTRDCFVFREIPNLNSNRSLELRRNDNNKYNDDEVVCTGAVSPFYDAIGRASGRAST